NVKVYILDKNLQILPVKIPGELCIGGIGLAQGYYNNKQLSEQKFIVVPHLPEKKVYRTGDLCRWLPDGNIEFLARIDHQVKIRGFRIELGEIENELLKHEEIKEAVVIARQDETGERGEYGENYLCAYIVPRAKQRVAISVLREYLGHRLPDYMVPAYFVYLEVMPLTPSGKINRRGLPEPELKMGKNYAAPRDHIEEALVKIWHEVLDNKALSVPGGTIGIDDNFFQLGGHSLKAAIMTAKVHKALHIEIPLGRVFETPTIRALSGYIKETKKKGYEPIESVLEREYYALSSAQKRLYILQQMELGSTVYNMPITMRLLGELDAGKLERIFSELITRHESLRTSFETVGDRPMQHIHTKVDFKIEYYGVDSAGRFDISHFVKVFDLSRPPLLRVGLIKTGANEHILLVDMHHIIADGTSLSIFSEEMMALYQGNKLPSLKITYKDYAAWQNSQKNKEIFRYREKFWLEQFDGEMPVLILPTDYSRPVMQSFAGNRVDFELNRQETGLLKKLAQSQGATIYMTILAACNTWLAKLSGEEDIIIGTPIAGRDREEFQGIIGMFVNTLPLRNYPEPGKIFVDFLTEIKERTLAALENQDYQFEDLVEKIVLSRDTSRNPLFDVMFVFQNMEMP
ncbi:MAG TPA: condensation domain-containing protein, partial [Candidatus Deferrimicrobium sp.]|nr:condensation domain-containing protein [Candidatus Deferrimicrobium sp.]